MQSNHETLRVIGSGMICLLLLLCLSGVARSQNQSAVPPPIRVGVVPVPPLYEKRADNQWKGFGVELWEAVAQILKIPFEFREFPTLPLLLSALGRGEIDVIPSLAVQDRLEPMMDFSQSYLKSGLAIAVPAAGVEHRWARTFEGLFSEQVLKAVGFMLLISFVAGLIVWAFERRRNSEMFGGGPVVGIGDGIWWALVTMSTVGYGDKSPKTIGGRIVALIWMIFSIVFIASFTANITTSFTIDELRGKVRGFNDLYQARVGSISGSEGIGFLSKQGINVIPFQSIEEGLAAVANKSIDAFVQDENVLKYLVKHEFPGRVLVLPGTYDEYFVSIALQENSPLRKSTSKAILKLMKTEKWTELVNRYFN